MASTEPPTARSVIRSTSMRSKCRPRGVAPHHANARCCAIALAGAGRDRGNGPTSTPSDPGEAAGALRRVARKKQASTLRCRRGFPDGQAPPAAGMARVGRRAPAWQDDLRAAHRAGRSARAGLADAVSATEQATRCCARSDRPDRGAALIDEWRIPSPRVSARRKGSGAARNRIEQAIETVQGCCHRCRPQLDRPPGISWYPSARTRQNFDQEWRWLGSYANWRAAMFAFLYGEPAAAGLRPDRPAPSAAGRYPAARRQPDPNGGARGRGRLLADLDADTGPGTDAAIGQDHLVAHWPLNEGRNESAAAYGNASSQAGGPAWVA